MITEAFLYLFGVFVGWGMCWWCLHSFYDRKGAVRRIAFLEAELRRDREES